VVDLVRSLRCLDSSSAILLYNGSRDPALLEPRSCFERLGASVCPAPRPIGSRQRYAFVLDSLRHAVSEIPFDALTIVVGRQLGLRRDWSGQVLGSLGERHGVGLLGSSDQVESASTRLAIANAAWQELPLWQPLLRRFEGGERHFVRVSRFPGLVLSRPACVEILQVCDREPTLADVLERSRLWALEEVLFPTLTGLCGFRVRTGPDGGAGVLAEDAGPLASVEAALVDESAWWAYPIAPRYDDPARRALRSHFDQYRPRGSRRLSPSAVWPLKAPADDLSRRIVSTMRTIEGWLADDEAELLVQSTQRALCRCPQADALVEVGSYCGRATSVLASVVRALRPSAKVWAVDPHDGFVGSLDHGLERVPPTLHRLRQNLEDLSLVPFVELSVGPAPQLAWSEPIALLLIDGVHDYPHVLRDFHHFEPWLVDGALVAFHDYADYFPGVPAFVDELCGSGRYRVIGKARSLIVLEKRAGELDAE
jgi:hypothetical protein